MSSPSRRGIVNAARGAAQIRSAGTRPLSRPTPVVLRTSCGRCAPRCTPPRPAALKTRAASAPRGGHSLYRSAICLCSGPTTYCRWWTYGVHDNSSSCHRPGVLQQSQPRFRKSTLILKTNFLNYDFEKLATYAVSPISKVVELFFRPTRSRQFPMLTHTNVDAIGCDR